MDENRKKSAVNLPSLSLPVKFAMTGYLVVIAFGLMMSGMQIFLTHGMADEEWGLSVRDIVYSYYGNRDNSRLEVKLNGTMKEMANIHDRMAIIEWVRTGSSEEKYKSEIAAVFEKNCTRCHGTIPGLIPLTTYEAIKPVAKIDQGATIGALVRVSHIHLFGIAFIFFFVVLIFSLAVNVPPLLQMTAIATPFLFLIIDIFSWWATKWYPSAAYLTMIGGLGYNSAGAFMIVTSLYQMWILPLSGRVFDQNTWVNGKK
jgi:hypothetical protein